jgi:glycosyltransferase involved in cell wall biosynthesis
MSSPQRIGYVRATVDARRKSECDADAWRVDVKTADSGGILCFATQGQGHIEDERIRGLLAPLSPSSFAFDRTSKLRSALRLLRAARKQRPQLIVMEGTGTAGGLTLLAIDALLGVPFVFSSGDAVGPFLGLRSRPLGVLGGAYERLLCRRCAGFVGWTPYLTGRALTFGAPRAMTAAGWTRGEPVEGARERIRQELGIAHDALVVGLVGSLHWNDRLSYAYGAELIRAIRRVRRTDLVVCVVGDGSGRARLAELAGEDLDVRVILPGRVAPEEVPDYLAAFDLGSLSQSVDGVGSFRYTTKLSEYLAVGLPVLTGETPLAYDLDEGFMWRLPGAAPWSETYIDALSALLEGLDAQEVLDRREAITQASSKIFDPIAQQRRMTAFVNDLIASSNHSA